MASLHNFSVYKERRADLISMLKQAHPKTTKGIVVLSANFEGSDVFVQESTFLYFTGIKEPGAVCILSLDGTQTLYVPNCMQERAKWVNYEVALTQENTQQFGFNAITSLGEKCVGYQVYPFSPSKEYAALIGYITACIQSGGTLFSTIPSKPYGYLHQRLLLSRLMNWVPGVKKSVVDCSSTIAAMRQNKTNSEIESIFKAIQITAEAHGAAAQAIDDGVNEAEVQASLEYIMTANNARKAFPSIVGSGPNATVLHYGDNNRVMKKGNLVVIDIGASYKGYASDITRTYPVGGTFSERQKEIYTLVLELQEYIVSLAQPGYYLRNAEHSEKSLHHLAIEYLKERGYDQYMPHGIGHYLGLDVHDVGDYTVPLKAGDVFTIEPGIYIKEEELGVRIEDDYWMTEKGVICLSEDIPKSIKDIETIVKKKFD